MDRRQFMLQTVVGASTCATSAYGATAHGAEVAQTSGTVPTLPQFLSWDGGSGPSRDFWSTKLQLPWVHQGSGDWLDARQTPQGGTAFATGFVTQGPVQFNVTTLVNRWLSTGLNRGFYLRSRQAWPFTFAGRSAGTAASRPRLLARTGQGTVSLDCLCNAAWSPSTYQASDSRFAFTLAQDMQFATLQFDLSKINGPVQNATLSLDCVSLKYPGAVEIFELDPPRFRDGAGALAPRVGIASNYVYDKGLETHPSVLFSGDFSDRSRARWQMGGLAAGSAQVKNPATGTTYLRGLIRQGELLGSDLQRVVTTATSAGVPHQPETELYGRYYVFLEEDWGSDVDANKMPGWDGRLGWWSPQGYWQNTTGNGGSRPTGLKVRNAAANRWEYEGASMRGHAGARANDGNPYDELFWIGSYIYHLDQVGNYGEGIHWPGLVIGKGRWYCIEQHIKMNTITAPFDALGNGVAVNDGQYRVWVDGVLAFERSNFRWRRHPEMGIQGFWLNWYHGGTAPSPHTMHFRMDSVVLARSYIGQRGVGTI